VKDLIIVGGPNGAGKTTFVQSYLQLRPLPYLSADAIAAELSPDNPTRARIQAGKEFSRRLQQAIAVGESLVVESTLSGRTLHRLLERARQDGYFIEILFLFLESSEICLNRVQERVRRGGHDVPEEDVRRRFYRSLVNFWRLYKHQPDRWYLFYNAETKFRLVAFAQKDGTETKEEIVDEEFFSVFVQGMGGNDEQG
jgi:predicted ABC-type ATPase